MGQTIHWKRMGLLGTGWFRRQRREVLPEPPKYPRIAHPDEDSTATPVIFDLFAFDQPIPAVWRSVHVEEITPVAPVGSQGVLGLALQAAWPEEHPLTGALADAWREQGGGEDPQRAGMWHLSPGRGIQGYLNGYQVLIGNQQLMRDGGIGLPDEVCQRLTTYEGRSWQAVLVAALTSDAHNEEARRSLIGILAVAPGPAGRSPAIEEPASAPDPAAPPTVGESPDRPPRPTLPDGSWPRLRRLRVPWRIIALLGFLSAVAGLYKSALTVAPDEVAVIQRSGRVVATCGPGLHFRSLWPLEEVVRVQPNGRLLRLELGASDSPPRETSPYSRLLVAREPVLVTGPAAPAFGPNRKTVRTYQVRAVVEYRVADPAVYAFATADPEALLARLAEATLRQSLAAPTSPGLTADWRSTLVRQLEALPTGLAIANASVTRIAPVAQDPGDVSPNIELIHRTEAEGRALIEAAQAGARDTISAAEVAARRQRSEALNDRNAQIAAARKEADRRATQAGRPEGSPDLACLQLIKNFLKSPLPGRCSLIVKPELGARCRIREIRAPGSQPASLWTWPAPHPATIAEEARP